MRLAYTNEIRAFPKDNILIELIPVDEQEHVTIFIISSDSKKVIYVPCDVKPFPASEKFQGADVLIIGNTIIWDVLKGGIVLNEDNPLRNSLRSMKLMQYADSMASKGLSLCIWKKTGKNL